MANLIKLKSFSDPRGMLTVIERELPSPIARVYFINQVPPETRRGGHAHKVTTQVLIAVSGSCVVENENDAGIKEEFLLDAPNKALILLPSDFHYMKNFSSDATLLVLASHPYDPSDYITKRE